MQIVDDVKQRKKKDYLVATAAEVERLSALPEVVAVYSTGMVKAPGISDLDLIAVIDLEQSSGHVRRSLKHALKVPAENYIRTHPIFAISPELFTQIRWLGDLSTLECLEGKELQADPVPGVYQNLLRAITTLETGIHKFFALRMFLQGKSMGARNLLLTLNSIGYSLSLAEQLGQCSTSQLASIHQFRSDLLELRSNWFAMDSSQRVPALVPLVELAPKLLLQALEVASRHVVQECHLDGDQSKGSGYLSVDPHGLVSLDLQHPRCDTQLEDMPFSEWRRRFDSQPEAGLQGPIGLAVPFAFYHARLQAEPKRQQYFDSRAQLDLDLQEWCLTASGPLREGLEQRATIICEYAKWYRPLWSCSISFSVYTSWLMGRRNLFNKIWAQIENKSLR